MSDNTSPDRGQPDGAPQEVPGDSATAGDCEFDDFIVYDPIGAVLQLHSANGETCMRMVRVNECGPDTICKAVPFSIVSVVIAHEDEREELGNGETMTWHATHHNWSDSAEMHSETMDYVLNYTDFENHVYVLTATATGQATPRWSAELGPYSP